MSSLLEHCHLVEQQQTMRFIVSLSLNDFIVCQITKIVILAYLKMHLLKTVYIQLDIQHGYKGKNSTGRLSGCIWLGMSWMSCGLWALTWYWKVHVDNYSPYTVSLWMQMFAWQLLETFCQTPPLAYQSIIEHIQSRYGYLALLLSFWTSLMRTTFNVTEGSWVFPDLQSGPRAAAVSVSSDGGRPPPLLPSPPPWSSVGPWRAWLWRTQCGRGGSWGAASLMHSG